MKTMSKDIFRENLFRATKELQIIKKLDFEKCLFKINPVIEKTKNPNNSDDIMCLWVLTEENSGGKIVRG